MRNLIQIVESFIALQEKVTDLHIHSGWTTLGGKPVMSDIRLWENPLREEFESAIHHCGKMDGDPNLRGLAHAGKVYVWDAELSTHDGVLRALGLYTPTPEEDRSEDSGFDYSDPSFCFFMVYGGKWMENPMDERIVVSYNGQGDNLSVLKKTSARRWTNVRYIDGGAFMGGY